MKFLSAFGAICCANVFTRGENIPIFMYVDAWAQAPDELEDEFVRMADAGVSHIMMAFHLEGNALFPDSIADTVALWNDLTADERQGIVSKLHQRGTKLLISSGGESEGQYWLTQDAKDYGTRLCTLAKGLGVDGIDFDKEGFGSVSKEILDWNIAATTACRQIWPEGLITSAPQSPHMYTQSMYNWADGISQGAAHDFYLIQYYNQGTWSKDTTYEGLFQGSGVGAINELMQKYGNAARKNQFVLGKPFSPADAGTGFVEMTNLRDIVCKAESELGYKGGLMFWQHPWGGDLSSVTMLAKPCSGESDNTTVAPPTVEPPVTTEVLSTAVHSIPIYTTGKIPVTYPTVPEDVTTRQAWTTAPQIITTTPTTAPTTTRNNTPDSDPITGCQTRISAKGEYMQFEDYCKDFCKKYSKRGQLAPWCPSSQTTDQLVNCVVTQQTYCIDTQ